MSRLHRRIADLEAQGTTPQVGVIFLDESKVTSAEPVWPCTPPGVLVIAVEFVEPRQATEADRVS